MLSDPPLEDGAVRPLLIGDAAAQIPRLMASARDLLANLIAMTGRESPLAASLGELQTTTARLNGPRGALGVLLGDGDESRRIGKTLEQADRLLRRLDAAAKKADLLAGQLNAMAGEGRCPAVRPAGAVARIAGRRSCS